VFKAKCFLFYSTDKKNWLVFSSNEKEKAMVSMHSSESICKCWM